MIFSLILILPALQFQISDSTSVKKNYSNSMQHESQSNEIIFLSDTQDVLALEYLWNETNNNKNVRELIFEDIIERAPKAVFHLGDLVSLGYAQRDWTEIDNFVKRLSGKHVPFYPILGNHELFILSKKGEVNFQTRFPFHSKTGYSVIIDSIAVILLNSNFNILSNNQIETQNLWYQNELNSLDMNPKINLVIVGAHHPPYTNSTRVDPSEEVQNYFVPAYLKSKKAKLFLSGHVHAFEHFNLEGKDFLVIGGGGGPQQKLLVADEVRWEDEFSDIDEIRRFHFASLKKKEKGYLLKIIMIDSSYNFLQVAYQINLKK